MNESKSIRSYLFFWNTRQQPVRKYCLILKHKQNLSATIKFNHVYVTLLKRWKPATWMIGVISILIALISDAPPIFMLRIQNWVNSARGGLNYSSSKNFTRHQGLI